MSARAWFRNDRGELYVLAQAGLMLLVLVGPVLDGSSVNPESAVAVGASAILFVTGLAFVVSGSLGLGRNLSPFPRPRSNGALVESGVFSLVRHPIYTGLSLLALGWSVLTTSPVALIATIFLFVFFEFKSRREEAWLRSKFAEYDDYAARVRKFVPFVY